MRDVIGVGVGFLLHRIAIVLADLFGAHARRLKPVRHINIAQPVDVVQGSRDAGAGSRTRRLKRVTDERDA